MPNKTAQRARRFEREFNQYWGYDENKLDIWQRLCEDVGIDAERSIMQCKKKLNKVNVSLVDLLEAKKCEWTPRTFRSRQALRDYIANDRSKMVPITAAKNNGFLKVLLIDVLA